MFLKKYIKNMLKQLCFLTVNHYIRANAKVKSIPENSNKAST